MDPLVRDPGATTIVELLMIAVPENQTVMWLVHQTKQAGVVLTLRAPAFGSRRLLAAVGRILPGDLIKVLA